MSRVLHQAVLQPVNTNTASLKLCFTDAIHQWLTPDFIKLGGHVGRKAVELVPAFSLHGTVSLCLGQSPCGIEGNCNPGDKFLRS